jgi:predicted phage terminase large subunit-like protein
MLLPWSIDAADGWATKRAEESLYFFIRLMWRTLEPATKFAEGWWPQAWCEHLEAVADGRITRLIGNCPPGSTKSLISNVFFPAWMWGPKRKPSTRFLTAAYSQMLTERDNDRMRTLVTSQEYQSRWGNVFKANDSKVLFANDRTGWKVASSVGGTITGQRGDIFIIDDPNNINESESKVVRESTNRWLAEVMPTRLNDLEKSAIVLIQQRTHQEDATGFLLDPTRGGDRWCYVMVPMTYDPDWTCGETSIGWRDPRIENGIKRAAEAQQRVRDAGGSDEAAAKAAHEAERGELFWPERFSADAVAKLRETMTDFSWAGQMQQHPEPRGGAIIKRDWWKLYGKPDEDPTEVKLRFPPFSFLLASLDCALTDKTENDPSAMVVLGIWENQNNLRQQVMLVHAWHDHLKLADLVKRVARECENYHVHTLLIENKASGHSVQQEILRQYQRQDWNTILVDPHVAGARDSGKVARVHSVTHLFEEGLIWHPNTTWAQDLIDESSIFPRGSHDDQIDALVMGLRYFRDNGILYRPQEKRWHEEDVAALARTQAAPRPLYDG